MSTSRSTADRARVPKTYKLFVGGAFPRSESGRSYPVRDRDGSFVANVAQASRKDLRDAVVAARKGFSAWSSASAYNRGQVLYRVAEVMEGRRAQFLDTLRRSPDKESAVAADTAVDAAIDRWVWYAGWTDKISAVMGGANPVAGPFFNFSLPEPTGVVGVIAPDDDPLLGLVSTLAPILATGSTALVLASEASPLAAVELAEVLATSDVPAGAANILTGRTAELAPWLASHMDVNAIDLSGVAGDLATELEVAAAENIKRVRRPIDEDLLGPPSVERLRWLLETKTVWHPMGV